MDHLSRRARTRVSQHCRRRHVSRLYSNANSSRVVWAVIYTFFLSFGIGIGSQIWDAFGPEQLTAEDVSKDSSSLSDVYLTGSFKTNSSQWDQTFSNGECCS